MDTSPPVLPPASPGRILRSLAIALAIAGALLATVVLPAEYGIDPTGVGRILGLTRMGEIKTRLAREAAADAAADAAEAAAETLQDTLSTSRPQGAP